MAQKLGRNWIGVELSPETIENYIAPRIEGILAGTDPLPMAGYDASAEQFRVMRRTLAA